MEPTSRSSKGKVQVFDHKHDEVIRNVKFGFTRKGGEGEITRTKHVYISRMQNNNSFPEV